MAPAAWCARLVCGIARKHRTRRRDNLGRPDCQGKHGQCGSCKGVALVWRLRRELADVGCTSLSKKRLRHKTKPRRILETSGAISPVLRARARGNDVCSGVSSASCIVVPTVGVSSVSHVGGDSATVASCEVGGFIGKAKELIERAVSLGFLSVGDDHFLLGTVTRLGNMLRNADSHLNQRMGNTDVVGLALFQIALALSPVSRRPDIAATIVTQASVEILRQLQPRQDIRKSALNCVRHILSHMGSA